MIEPISRADKTEEKIERGYIYYETPVASKIHHYYLSHAIEDPERYIAASVRLEIGQSASV